MSQPVENLVPGSAAYYRKRFESSVRGNHMMMPPKEIAEKMVHPEAPPTHPKGPNTSFQFLTPMPFRFKEEALPAVNAHHEKARKEHPIYETSASVIGKMAMQATDFPMRWYGLEGEFTTKATAGGMALPKTRVNTGLNTSFDHSDVHHAMDQGWSGHLGLTDFNIANRDASKFVVRKTRTAPIA